MKFLTTDIFVSFLTETDTPRAKAARAIFETVESGTEQITTSTVVLWELITLLTGSGVPRDKIAGALLPLLNLRSFALDDKQVWTDALTLWQDQPLELTDAYNTAYTRRHGLSFLPGR